VQASSYVTGSRTKRGILYTYRESHVPGNTHNLPSPLPPASQNRSSSCGNHSSISNITGSNIAIITAPSNETELHKHHRKHRYIFHLRSKSSIFLPQVEFFKDRASSRVQSSSSLPVKQNHPTDAPTSSVRKINETLTQDVDEPDSNFPPCSFHFLQNMDDIETDVSGRSSSVFVFLPFWTGAGWVA